MMMKWLCPSQQPDSRTIKWMRMGEWVTLSENHLQNENRLHNWCLQTWQTIISPGWQLSLSAGAVILQFLFSLCEIMQCWNEHSLSKNVLNSKNIHVCHVFGTFERNRFCFTQFLCEPKCTLTTAFCVEEIWPYDAEQCFLTWDACPPEGGTGVF